MGSVADDVATPAKPYCDYGAFLRARYGAPVERVPLDLGFGCPRRAPGGAGGGCAFCGEWGGRAGHITAEMPLSVQLRRGIDTALARRADARLMAYFQADTATNAPVDVLAARVRAVLAAAPFAALTFATRPDCLPEPVLDFLAELTRAADVWVELGVQTANERTLARINRGHDFATAVRAVHDLSSRGVNVAAHMIIGLPGEGVEDCCRTAAALARLPLAGVKIHNLHIVSGTPLAAEWRAGRVHDLDEHEYAAVLVEVLRRLPPTWPIMRLVSDTPRRRLLAPHWWLSKAEFVALLERQMRDRNVRQGDCRE